MKFRKLAVILKIIKYPLLLSGVLVASLLIATAVYMSDVKEVQILRDGKATKVVTTKATVSDALSEAGIILAQNEILNCSLTDSLKDISKIVIESPTEIHVSVRGSSLVLSTFADTVSEALTEAGITITGSDIIEGAELDSIVFQGMNISINSYTEQYYEESFVLEHDVRYVEDNTMLEGDYKTLVTGKDGLRTLFYRVYCENGEEITTEKISEDYVAPVDTVISYGTILNFKNPANETIAYTKKYTMVATAYSPTKENNYWATSIYYPDGSNFRNREGGVAVDPKVIPLGTLLYVKGLNGMPDYGYAFACDMGKSIKGNKIDLFMESEDNCVQWGIKNVEVYVLYDQSLSTRELVSSFLAKRNGRLFVNGGINQNGKIYKE